MVQRVFRCLIFLALTAALTGQFGWVMASDGSPAGPAPGAAGQTDAAGRPEALPDPAVMTYRLPDELKFDPNKTSGSANFVLYGDPNKPGSPYEYIQKWYPHSMSRPHFHLHDRYIYVVSGTWWLGWGPKYDPDHTFPVPAGSFVHHFGRQLHYDGAKDEPCILIISGIGPAPSFTPDKIKESDEELEKQLKPEK